MGQALFLKTILMRDSDLTFLLETKAGTTRNKRIPRWRAKKGITYFAIPCIICISHYIKKKYYLLYFSATILAHSVPSIAALTIPPAYPAPSPAG